MPASQPSYTHESMQPVEGEALDGVELAPSQKTSETIQQDAYESIHKDTLEVAAARGLDPNSLEAVMETGDFQVYEIENDLKIYGPDDPRTQNDIVKVLVESVDQESAGVDPDITPQGKLFHDPYTIEPVAKVVNTLSTKEVKTLTGEDVAEGARRITNGLDGIGSMDEFVGQLHETYPSHPSGHEAAPIMADKTAELANHPVMEAPGVVEFVDRAEGAAPVAEVAQAQTEAITNTNEKKEISDQQVLADAQERMARPVEMRKGTEIVDAHTGEVFKPAVSLEIGDEDASLVLESLQSRRASMAKMNDFLNKVDSGEVTLSDATTPAFSDEIEDLLRFNISPVSYEAESKQRKGSLADVYMSPSDVDEIVALGARLDALPRQGSTGIPSESYGLNKEAMAQRTVDYIEQTIPEGTPLVHTASREKAMDIVAGGSLKSRFMIEPRHTQDSITRNGPHTQYVHFAEPGKVNRYGDVAIAIPIEDIINVSPMHQAEAMYRGSKDDTDTQEKMGRVVFDKTDAPLALERRLATLRDRFTGELVVEDSQGNANNLAFAASSELNTAAAYEYPVDTATVYMSEGVRPQEEAFFNTIGRDKDWLDTHIAAIDGNGLTTFNPGALKLPMPKSLEDEGDALVAYGPVSQRRVDFGEQSTGYRAVNLNKKQESQYEAYIAQTAQAERDNNERIRAANEELQAAQAGMTVEDYRVHQEAERQKNIVDVSSMTF